MKGVTEILARIESGAPSAAEQLVPPVYAELSRLTQTRFAHDRPGQTLEVTELVHDAYLRGVDLAQAAHGDSPRHFFAAAAEAMRCILVEHARRRKWEKHGGGQEPISLENACSAARNPSCDLSDLDDALTRLASLDAKETQVEKLQFFAEMTISEAALDNCDRVTLNEGR